MDLILKKVEKLGIFFVIYTLYFLLFFGTLKFTIPFILALIFAFLLRIPTRFLIKKLKIKGWLASLITTSIFFIFIATVTTLLVIALASETIDITKYLQDLLSAHSSDLTDYFTNLQNTFSKFNIDINPEILNTLKSNITGSLNSIISGALNATTSLLHSLLKFLGYIPYVLVASICTILSTYFFTQSLSKNDNTGTLNKLSPTQGGKIKTILLQVKKMLGNYLFAYAFIIFLSMAFTFLGFSILGIEYSLVLSILAGILDLLPIVGMALVYIPLAIIYFLQGNSFMAIAILVLYAIVCVARQIIEPKIMSSSLGINPVASLAAMFVGMQLGGFTGIIFCLFLVVTHNILRKVELF